MIKCEKTVKKRQSKSEENIREEKSLNQCFQSAHIRNLLDFDWLVSRHPRKKRDHSVTLKDCFTLFLFVIETLFILLHDHFISDLSLGVQSFIQFYFLYACQKYIHWLLIKYVYEVVRSLPHWKELSESFRGYFNRKKFVVSLTPESRSDVSHAGIFCSSLFFHFCARRIIVYCFLWRKNRTFLSSFHGKCCI